MYSLNEMEFNKQVFIKVFSSFYNHSIVPYYATLLLSTITFIVENFMAIGNYYENSYLNNNLYNSQLSMKVQRQITLPNKDVREC